MLTRLAGTQFELERTLAEAILSGSDVTDLTSRLASIAELRQTLMAAPVSDLPALRQSINTAIIATTIVIHASAATPDKGKSASDEERRTSNATVNKLVDAYYEKRVLDPYLRFASAEQEDAYRDRERERKEAIDREQAKGTPEGQRNAARLMLDQLRDAGLHGADRAPQFSGMLRDAERAEATLNNGVDKRPREGAAVPTDLPPDSLEAAMAEFRAAGVEVAATDRAGHGLRDQGRQQQAEVTVRR